MTRLLNQCYENNPVTRRSRKVETFDDLNETYTKKAEYPIITDTGIHEVGTFWLPDGAVGYRNFYCHINLDDNILDDGASQLDLIDQLALSSGQEYDAQEIVSMAIEYMEEGKEEEEEEED